MKKSYSLILAVLLAAGILTACSKDKDESSYIDSGTQSTITTPPTSPPVTDISSTDSSSEDDIPEEPIDLHKGIVDIARQQIGVPYLYAGAAETGFDSPGLLFFVAQKNGLDKFPRNIAEQVLFGEAVGFDDLEIGDFVYFANEPGSSAAFGGVYSGDGRMIYSSMPGENVKETMIATSYWIEHFVTGIRLE